MCVASKLCTGFFFTPLMSSDPFQGSGVNLDGLGVLSFYFSLIGKYLEEYPVPIRICYFIVLCCIVVMILLYFMFFRDFIRRRRMNKKYDSLVRRFHDPFLEILSNDKLSIAEMEEIMGCKRSEIIKNNPEDLSRLIASVRMEIYEVIYLPNLQTLVEATGVLNYFEECLLKNRNVFNVLQTLLMFQIVVTEGRLAGYVNSHDPNIRMMARMLYILCSQNDPYYYLLDELNSPQSMMRPMMLHYIFGWRKEQNKLMPDFLSLVDRIENDETASFMIREVAYWGNDEEKRRIPDYYLSPRYACRLAAISGTAHLVDDESEEKLVQSFPSQPQEVKHAILRAMLVIRSDRHVEFLKQVIKETPSHTSRELALSCLYNGGPKGRLAFENLRESSSGELKTLMNQIDSISMLTQIQSLK